MSGPEKCQSGAVEKRPTRGRIEYPIDAASAIKMGYQHVPLQYNWLENPGIQHTGARAIVTYKEILGEQQKTATGIICLSLNGGFDIQDPSGEIIDISQYSHFITEAYFLPSGITWKSFQRNSIRWDGFGPIERLHGHFAIFNGGRKLRAAGELGVEEYATNRRAITITDQEGRKHVIDPEYLNFMNLAVATKHEDTIDRLILDSGKKPIELIDDKIRVRRKTAQELGKDLMEGKKTFFANPKLYEYVGNELSPKQRRELIGRSYHRDAGTHDMADVISDLLGEAYTALLFDPGIAGNFSMFIDFIKRPTTRRDSLISLRESFSDWMGNTTVYRGMALTEDEASYIKENGLFAPALSFPNNDIPNRLDGLLDYHTAVPMNIYSAMMNRQVDADYSRHLLCSVSRFPEVAAAIGWHDSPEKTLPGKKPYLIQMDMPVIDVYAPVGIFEGTLRHYDRVVRTGGHKYEGDEDLELFTAFYTPAKYLAVKELPEIPPRWQFE